MKSVGRERVHEVFANLLAPKEPPIKTILRNPKFLLIEINFFNSILVTQVTKLNELQTTRGQGASITRPSFFKSSGNQKNNKDIAILFIKSIYVRKARMNSIALLEERGQGLVEYALILVLVVIVVFAVVMVLGPVVGNVFSTVNDSLSTLI